MSTQYFFSYSSAQKRAGQQLVILTFKGLGVAPSIRAHRGIYASSVKIV